MKLKKNIATSEAGLIFNPATGDSFSVNGIGNVIFSRLRASTSRDEITEFLISRYEVERKQLEKDLDDFISLLNDYSLLDD